MNGRFLLDTNIVIALFARDASVQQHLATARTVFVPSIVLGELYFGARKSARAETNRARVREFASSSAILVCDAITAEQYGEIKKQLEDKGRPIPDNDIWIAALSRQHKLTVISRDVHFKEVEGLKIEKW